MSDGIDAAGLKEALCHLAGILMPAVSSTPWIELQMLDVAASNARLVIRLPGVPAVGSLKTKATESKGSHACTTNQSVAYDYDAMEVLITAGKDSLIITLNLFLSHTYMYVYIIYICIHKCLLFTAEPVVSATGGRRAKRHNVVGPTLPHTETGGGCGTLDNPGGGKGRSYVYTLPFLLWQYTSQLSPSFLSYIIWWRFAPVTNHPCCRGPYLFNQLAHYLNCISSF